MVSQQAVDKCWEEYPEKEKSGKHLGGGREGHPLCAGGTGAEMGRMAAREPLQLGRASPFLRLKSPDTASLSQLRECKKFTPGLPAVPWPRACLEMKCEQIRGKGCDPMIQTKIKNLTCGGRPGAG